MQVILRELAVVCLHAGCEVIFEGPSLVCPLCGWQGAAYIEVEEMAIKLAAGPQSAGLRLSTSIVH
jgi:hypothetical protein